MGEGGTVAVAWDWQRSDGWREWKKPGWAYCLSSHPPASHRSAARPSNLAQRGRRGRGPNRVWQGQAGSGRQVRGLQCCLMSCGCSSRTLQPALLRFQQARLSCPIHGCLPATLGPCVHGGAPLAASQLHSQIHQIESGSPRASLPGRVRFIVSGGAPLAPHVEDFCNVCMAPLMQASICLLQK